MTREPPLMRAGTRRDPSRRTDGNVVARTAELLGKPLLPWQRYVADVAGELDDATGTYRYDTIVLTTPRQCGKSTLIDTEDTRNAQLGRDRKIYYLAQTGKDAEQHFKEYVKQLRDSRLAPLALKPRLSNGGMEQRFANGSFIRPLAVTKVAGHGVQMDKFTLDEAFSLTKEAGYMILDGLGPTMNTRLRFTGVQPQMWITSTEGTAASTFFNTLLDGLRAGDVPERTAWFDFGLPDDEDPEDLKAVARWHPAAGMLWDLRQLADFRQQFGDNKAGWARAFANRRDVGIAERIISADLWNATTCWPIAPGDLAGRPVVFGAAVDVDATHTAISAGILEHDGTVNVQLLKVLDGTGAAPNEITRLCATYDAPLCMDSRGPNGDLCDRLKALADINGDPVVRFVDMQAGDFLSVGQAFVSGLENGTVRHAADTELDASAANSARAWSGDAWRISRRGSTGKTSPLESAMLAAWGVSHRPEPEGPLQIF